jgi:hypothetical protein
MSPATLPALLLSSSSFSAEGIVFRSKDWVAGL